MKCGIKLNNMADARWWKFSIFRLILVILFVCTTFESDEFEGQMSIMVQHSLDPILSSNFSPRGTISLKSIRNGIANYNADYSLTPDDRRKLKDLVQKNGLYRVRVLVKSENNPRFVSTFVRACSLYESHLSDKISLYLDQHGEILGVSLTTQHMLCEGITVPENQLINFNTSVEIRQMENGPTPDITSYVQKIEKEKAEKAKGDQGDNRSFFAKYWMYIVPVFIFLLISGATNPEGQGGGGR